MELNHPNTSPSSSTYNDQKRDPDDSAHQSASDDVSFGFKFNHLQIDGEKDSNPVEFTPEEDQIAEEEEGGENDDEEDVDVDVDEDADDDDEEFTFVSVGENENENENDSSTTEVNNERGQIRTVFPLFDQSLLLGGDFDFDSRRLPMDVPVNNVFIESPRRSLSEYGETDGTGTVQALSTTESESGVPEINIKSNSTGFSKLWRFRNNEMNRSNSDGRDAFVFLESPGTATTSESKQKSVSVTVSGSSTVSGSGSAAYGGGTAKVNVAGGKGKVVKQVSKVKKGKASAHEVYLKQKEGRSEEDRRRSYLPYRPGLMGFFTNVNGGLSKNVHPF